MEYGVGRGSHGNIHGHGIDECLTGSNATGQHALVTILVIGQRVLHNLTGSLLHQSYTVLMGSQNGAITW